MDTKILSEIGLSSREIAVYLALLKLGSTTAGPLVKESEVQNAKIYETLEKMMKKGLVTYVVKQSIKHFQAVNPITLINFFDEKKNRLQNTVNELQIIQQHTEPECNSRVFEGVRSIKSAFF